MVNHQSIQFVYRGTVDRNATLPGENLLPEFFSQLPGLFQGPPGPIRFSPSFLQIRHLTRSEQVRCLKPA
jgi:hypothetical protein